MSRKTDLLIRRLEALVRSLTDSPPGEALAQEIERALSHWERALAHQSPAPMGGDAAPQGSGPIHIWCDGSCAPNPGPGGWAAIVEAGGQREELSGASPASTNNIMEMTAAIEALRRTPEGARVHVTTDSRYLMDGITKWLPGWKRRGWRKADGGTVLNRSLWEDLDALMRTRKITWGWVRGHSGHPENERVDRLANEARTRLVGGSHGRR